MPTGVNSSRGRAYSRPFLRGPWPLAGSLCWPHFLPLPVPRRVALSVDQGINGFSVLGREGPALGGGGALPGGQGAAPPVLRTPRPPDSRPLATLTSGGTVLGAEPRSLECGGWPGGQEAKSSVGFCSQSAGASPAPSPVLGPSVRVAVSTQTPLLTTPAPLRHSGAG